MAAYVGQIAPIEESFNVTLPTNIAEKYGATPSTSLSVPIRISKGTYDFANQYTVLPEEKTHLAAAQQRFLDEYATFSIHASRPKLSVSQPPIFGNQLK